MKKIFTKGSYFFYTSTCTLYYFAFGMFSCIISVYLAKEGFSATEISIITAASPLFAMVSQPICGIIADKIQSPKKVLLACAILSTLSGIGFAHSQSIVLLFLFNGFTQGCLNGILPLNDRMTTASPYPYGSIRLWGSLAWAIAAQISGYILEVFPGVVNFYLFAIIAALLFVSTLFLFDVKAEQQEKESFSIKELFHYFIHNRSFMLFLIIFVLFQGPTSANGIYQPLLFLHNGGTTTLVGTTLLLSTLLEIPVIYYYDRIMKRFSYQQLMLFACLLSSVRFFWYATNPSSTLITMMCFFQALTSLIFILIAVRIIIDIVDEKYITSAYGISSMLARGFSALVFQIGSGIIIDAFPGDLGFTVVYSIYGVVFLIAATICLKYE